MLCCPQQQTHLQKLKKKKKERKKEKKRKEKRKNQVTMLLCDYMVTTGDTVVTITFSPMLKVTFCVFPQKKKWNTDYLFWNLKTYRC